MKNFLFLLAMIPLTFVSCGSDDSEPQEPDNRPTLLVGKWQLTEMWKVWSGLGYSYESHWVQVQGELLFTMNSNGTCSKSGSATEHETVYGSVTMDFDVWFPQIDEWQWDASNTQYPLKLHFPTSANYGNYNVTFSNNGNNMEIRGGDLGYRFQRIN